MSGINAVNGGKAQIMAGASGHMPTGHKLAGLFNKMDTNHSGSISKAQFDSSFQSLNLPAGLKAMGANAIFAKLDPHGTGVVSKQDFIAGMRSISAKRGQAANQPAVASATTLSSGLNSLNSALGKNENQQSPQHVGTKLSHYV